MRVVVIGGTGFIGPYVVRKLIEAGHEVAVFHRGRTASEVPGASSILGDYGRLGEYASQFRDFRPEVVLDMIPATGKQALRVMDTFRGLARRVVAISSQDVYRAWGVVLGIESGLEDPLLIEESPLREALFVFRGRPAPKYNFLQNPDHYDKIPVEKIAMGDPELPGTILRLPMVYGPGDPLHRLYPYLKRMDDGRPFILLAEATAQWRAPVGYVENMADAIVLAVTDRRAEGRVYNVAEPDSPSQAEWVRQIGQATGWQGRVAVVPRRLLPGPRCRLEQHCVSDTRRIRSELEYREAVPRAEALRRTAEWERSHPPEDPAAIDYAADDRILAEWESVGIST